MGRQNKVKKNPDVRAAADEALLAGKTLQATADEIKKKTGKDVTISSVSRYRKQEAAWLEGKVLNDKLIAAMTAEGKIDGMNGTLMLITTATLNLFRQAAGKNLDAAELEKLSRTLLSVQKSEALLAKRDERVAAATVAEQKEKLRAAFEETGTSEQIISTIIGTIYGTDV